MKNVLGKIGDGFKFLWTGLSTRIWFIVTCVLLVVITTLNLVVTQNVFLYNTLVGVLGGETAYVASGDASNPDYQYFESSYDSKEEVLSAANDFNETIVEDGAILLKNENATLPLATPVSSDSVSAKPKISIFGKNSTDMVFGGSGSSEADSSSSVDLYTALETAGYDINPTLKSFYESTTSGSGRPDSPQMGSTLTGFPTGETAVSSYTTAVKSSYSSYNDASIVVISRIGGEGYDLPRTSFWNNRNYTSGWSTKEESRVAIDGKEMDDHYLELDSNELAMIQEAQNCSDKVIVLINVSQSMELAPIQDDSDIDAVLWIGGPGGTGLNAVGRILNGEVNPSGRTVDTFVTDLKNDPTWENFGNNLVSGGNQYLVEKNGDYIEAGKYTVDYEEGIYIGYKYYETRGYTDGEDWYNEAVVYPLGYGLSYSSFTQTIVNASDLTSTQLTESNTVSVEVEVKNTGSVAGKDVVQVYYSAPYTAGEIE